MKVTLLSVFPDLTAFGLRHIGACLNKQGHDVKIIFLPDSGFRKITNLEERRQYRYPDIILDEVSQLSEGSDLVGISLFSCYVPQAIALTERIKTMNIPVLWGGKHPSAMPEDSLQYADMVALGEGELAIQDLATKMEAGQDYFDTEGFHFNTPNGVKENPVAAMVNDLDTLPWIDYDFCPHYVWDQNGGDKIVPLSNDLLAESLLTPNSTPEGKTFLVMMTRGCPFGCTYCFTFKDLYKGEEYVRNRSVENFIQELEMLKNKYDFVSHFSICDDEFLAQDMPVIEEFADKYQKRIGMPFSCLASPWHSNVDKLRPLVDAGLQEVQMGVETVSKNGKMAYKRNIGNKKIMKAVKAVNEYRHQLTPSYDFILDNPFEETEDILTNIRFVLEIPKPFHLDLFSLVLFPGTAMFNDVYEDRLERFPDYDLDYMKLYLEQRPTYLNMVFHLFNKGVPNWAIRFAISKPLVYLFQDKGLGKMFYVMRDFMRATGIPSLVNSIRGKQATGIYGS